MEKLKEIKIRVENEEDLKKIYQVLGENGYKWINGESISDSNNYDVRTAFWTNFTIYIIKNSTVARGEYEINYQPYCLYQKYTLQEFINYHKKKENTMESLVKLYKEQGLPEPKQTYRKIELTGSDDMLTEEGLKIFCSWLLTQKEIGEKFYEEVAKPIRVELEKEDE